MAKASGLITIGGGADLGTGTVLNGKPVKPLQERLASSHQPTPVRAGPAPMIITPTASGPVQIIHKPHQ